MEDNIEQETNFRNNFICIFRSWKNIIKTLRDYRFYVDTPELIEDENEFLKKYYPAYFNGNYNVNVLKEKICFTVSKRSTKKTLKGIYVHFLTFDISSVTSINKDLLTVAYEKAKNLSDVPNLIVITKFPLTSNCSKETDVLNSSYNKSLTLFLESELLVLPFYYYLSPLASIMTENEKQTIKTMFKIQTTEALRETFPLVNKNDIVCKLLGAKTGDLIKFLRYDVYVNSEQLEKIKDEIKNCYGDEQKILEIKKKYMNEPYIRYVGSKTS